MFCFEYLRRHTRVAQRSAATIIVRAWQRLGSCTYDSIGRVATATDAAGLTMGYQYDPLDQATATLLQRRIFWQKKT